MAATQKESHKPQPPRRMQVIALLQSTHKTCNCYRANVRLSCVRIRSATGQHGCSPMTSLQLHVSVAVHSGHIVTATGQLGCSLMTHHYRYRSAWLFTQDTSLQLQVSMAVHSGHIATATGQQGCSIMTHRYGYRSAWLFTHDTL